MIPSKGLSLFKKIKLKQTTPQPEIPYRGSKLRRIWDDAGMNDYDNRPNRVGFTVKGENGKKKSTVWKVVEHQLLWKGV